MSRWRVELRESIKQESVYIIEAETEEDAKQQAMTTAEESEIQSRFVDDVCVTALLSIKPYSS